MSIPASSPQSSAAYRGALLALQKQQRARLQLLIQQTEGALAADWTRGPGIVAQYYAPVIDAYAKALNDLRLAEDDPAAKLSISWLTSQNAQLASIEQSVRASMLNYGQQAAKTVEDAQLAALAKGQQDAEALTQEALSPAWEKGVNPALLWNRPNPDAIAAWAGRAGNGHPLGDLFANFASEATHEARQVLLTGLATGANPKALATGLQQAMGISRSRALTISRTELLGSYRTAAHESYRANADVLDGWMWSAGGANPCAMCAGMDGTIHDLSEDLSDHPCGKCSPLPITKPWSDILGPLGIDTSDMEETSIGAPGNYTSISDKFDSYSPEKQRAIIGTQTGYDAYKRGEVTLKDFIGVRPAQDGWPSQYYQKSLKELQIPTRQASRLVELRPDLMAKYQAGKLRASDLGKFTPYEQLPKWAQQSREAEIVYQILRNGLPYNMTSHEQGLLITNLEQMLKGKLPVNVRAAAERQLIALGQSVERQTVGMAAKDVAERAATAYVDAADAANAAHVAVTDTEEITAAARDLSQRDLQQIVANREVFTDPNTGRKDFWTAELHGEQYFIRPAYGEVSNGSALTSLADRVGLGENFVKVQNVEVDGKWYEVQPLLAGKQADEAVDVAKLSTDAYLGADERMKVSLFTSLLGDDDRMANNMWITPDDKLLQIDYGNVFKPGMPTPYGNLLRPIDVREEYATFLALNDAPVVSEAVMDWLRTDLLSPDTRQAILDAAAQLGVNDSQIVPFQAARLEAYQKFAELPGTPTLGDLRKILESDDIRQLLALGQSVERQTVGAAAKDVAQAVEQTASREAIQAADVAIKEDLGRAATHIAEEDVARFTANNAPDIPSVGYHYGNPEHLARLGREGIDVARNRVGAFGQGFYMFSQDLSTVDNAAFVADASFRYGTDAVQVAVHIENPYRFTSEEQWRAIFKEYADKYGFENWEKQFTADLLQQGYDGVIVPASTLEDPFMPVTQIVAIKPGSVRVIIPEGSK